MRQTISGWGRHPKVEALVRTPEDLASATVDAVLSRGLGRAYGDAALPPPDCPRPVVVSTRADRILAFDAETGVLRAEAGLSLEALATLYLPRGWFTPVSTGTRYVTLGGMVASDVHGKNHHVDGTFSNGVRSLRMRVADGRILEVNRTAHPELFWATVGGMGLTGHILEVEVALAKVPTPWIREWSQRYGTFREVFDALGEVSRTSPMTAAWIDVSATGRKRGRGIVIWGRWAERDEAPADPPQFRPGIGVPDVFPSGVFTNAWTFRLANALWWHKHPRRQVDHVVSPASFFWQLDLARNWNRGFGRKGFTQYQCVMPSDASVYEAFLDRFQKLGGTSFVTVFKDCGEAGDGLLSFPMRGTSLAVDIPIRDEARSIKLVQELNAFVLDQGGRVYLAKDAFTSAAAFRQMYPQWEAFQAVRDAWDPERRLQSAQGLRLFEDSDAAKRLRQADPDSQVLAATGS